ncbi:MAG: TlpA family protein disulfide reductase [Bacteroidetes bacterium]|nr:TlpA family protein disulfide reductase [Bacteroidota bacterium]
MLKKSVLISLFACFFTQGFSQTINLIFPKLPNSEAWIYTFTGNKVDSVQIFLDKQGKATHILPQKLYRGIAYLYIPQKGGGEFIVAEPLLTVTNNEERFNSGSLIFPHSKENEFLRYIFERRNFLSQKQEWLIAGSMFIEKGSPFAENLQSMKTKNEQALKQFTDSVKNSKFYAAQYSQLVLFMQKLYENVQKPELAQFEELKNEMERTLPIEALYHAGNLWTNVHNYYPGLFAVNFEPAKAQEAYAQSIITTMSRLQEPVLTEFLLSTITACERSNQQIAIDKLLDYVLEKHPKTIAENPKMKRLLQSHTLKQGSKAPEITGLKTKLTQPAVVIFFESDCGHCIHELDELNKNAALLQSKGYRIISIAADVNKDLYNAAAKNFKWNKDDQLCDFKGFDGENFKKFAVGATPTIFMISADGKILGKYAQLKEIQTP